MKYIAFLRGINVGRKNRIKMADLKLFFQSIGFKNVKTYLQSGNVIFDGDFTDTEKIAADMERGLDETFGLSIKVILRSLKELEAIINVNPLLKDPEIQHDKLHVTFLKDHRNGSIHVKMGKNDKFEFNGTEIYLYLPEGYSRTKLTNNLWEKKLNVIATTRNWKTVNKLLKLSK